MLHFSSTVSAAKIFQNINTLQLISIRHDAGAQGKTFATNIAVVLVGMTTLTLTVVRMP